MQMFSGVSLVYLARPVSIFFPLCGGEVKNCISGIKYNVRPKQDLQFEKRQWFCLPFARRLLDVTRIQPSFRPLFGTALHLHRSNANGKCNPHSSALMNLGISKQFTESAFLLTVQCTFLNSRKAIRDSGLSGWTSCQCESQFACLMRLKASTSSQWDW